MKDIAKTARFWDRIEAGRPLQFWDLPVVHRYRLKLVSGSPDVNWLQWFAEHFVTRPAAKGISLGCGSGYMERTAIEMGFARRMLGVDISPGRLQKARELAASLPIEYQQQDLNRVRFFKDSFDFAVCRTILHHIENLEHLLKELKRALKPGSLLYIDEYVGPKRFQFSEQVLQMGDQVLQTIPEELRRLRHDPGHIKTRISRIDALKLMAADPSEAVRSDEIDRLLKDSFTPLAEHVTGGELLFRLLDGICHNFDPNNPHHNQILNALCAFEEQVMRDKALPAIFKLYVLRNDKHT